jgi:hypothetical protein
MARETTRTHEKRCHEILHGTAQFVLPKSQSSLVEALGSAFSDTFSVDWDSSDLAADLGVSEAVLLLLSVT